MPEGRVARKFIQYWSFVVRVCACVCDGMEGKVYTSDLLGTSICCIALSSHAHTHTSPTQHNHNWYHSLLHMYCPCGLLIFPRDYFRYSWFCNVL